MPPAVGLASRPAHGRGRGRVDATVRATSSVALAAAAALAAAVACTSPSSSSEGNASIGGYCARIDDYAEQCNKTDPCTQAFARNCASYESSLSAAYDSALGACLAPPYDCGESSSESDGGSPQAVEGCLDARLAAAMPTGAQAHVRVDFCETCPDGASRFVPDACSNFFALEGSVAPGAGLLVLLVNDRIAADVDRQCTGDAARSDSGARGDCALAFAACSGAVILAAQPEPGACSAPAPDASAE